MLGILSIFKIVILIFKKNRKSNDYIVPIIYFAIYQFMLFDINQTKIKVLVEIEKDKPLFQSCCDKPYCKELGE